MTAHAHRHLRHLSIVPPLPGSENLRGDVAVISQDDHTRVILHGHIDYRIGDELEEAARFCLYEQRQVVADVRNLESIDSVGVSIIVRVGAEMRRNHTYLLLQGPCQRLAELLTIVGAADFVRWLPSQPQPEQPTGHYGSHLDGPIRANDQQAP